MKFCHIIHVNAQSCLHKCQVVSMHAFEVASMHVSKPCYIRMYSSIDKPFWFNVLLMLILILRHITNYLLAQLILSFVYLGLNNRVANLPICFVHSLETIVEQSPKHIDEV